MKTIGLIGGMTWESTTLYYQTINREVSRRQGGSASAPMIVMSLDFETITRRERAQDWNGIAQILAGAARRLESAGADCLLVGSNTMHRVATQVQDAVDVPLLHIDDVTAIAIKRAGLSRVGLLGSRFMMEQPFHVERFAGHGIECIVPEEPARIETDRIIVDELSKGDFRSISRLALKEIIGSLAARGAEGVVLGGTELPLVVTARDSPIPVFDTTALHAMAAVDFCLQP